MNKNSIIYKIVSKFKGLFPSKKKELDNVKINAEVRQINQESKPQPEVLDYIMNVLKSSPQDYNKNMRDLDNYMQRRKVEQDVQERMSEQEESRGPQKVLRLHNREYTIH